MASGMSCYRHPDQSAVAQCKRCGRNMCGVCFDLYSRSSDKLVGLCRDCVVKAGIECDDHPKKKAVALCSDCGKGICQDCYDSYGAGMGAGKELCFDCTEKMVKDHSSDISVFRKKVRKERTWMIVGAVIGIIPAIAVIADVSGGDWRFFWGISYVFMFASIGTFFKLIASGFAIANIFGAAFALLGGFFIAPFVTIYRFIKRINQIKQANEIIATDERILQEMRDYFAYSQSLENNKGVDLAKLVEQDGELFNNTYAQSVLKNGEQAAQAELRQSVVTIAANGEIIRNFDKKPKKKENNVA